MLERSYLLLLFGVFLPFFSTAQFVDDTSTPYFRYALTAGGGGNQLYGDLVNKPIGPSAYVRGAYFITHGLQVGVELQSGALRGEDDVQIDGMVRRALNRYHAGIIDVRFQPSQYFQEAHVRRTEYLHTYGRRVLNSAYLGLGGGSLYNLQWNRERPQGELPEDSHHYGKDEGFSFFVTGNVGFELPLHKLKPYLVDSRIWSLVVNGQANFAFDDEVDGYGGGGEVNTSKDVFGVVSIGVNVRF